MSKSNIARQLAQVQPGTLHAGVDLALENNVVVVINEKAERLDHFSFPQAPPAEGPGTLLFWAATSHTDSGFPLDKGPS